MFSRALSLLSEARIAAHNMLLEPRDSRDLAGDTWLRRGVVEGHSFTVRALACIIVGHVVHHAAILEDRYRWSQLTARGGDAMRRPN
jgi:hypothetical protein